VCQVSKWNFQGLPFYRGSNFPFSYWYLNGPYKICIYSNFSPKIGCHGKRPFVPCVKECHRWIPWLQKPYLKTNHCMDTTEVIAIFVIFWPILAKIWLPWQSLRPMQSEMSFLDCLTPKTIPRTKILVNSCYTNEVMSIRRIVTSLALQE